MTPTHNSPAIREALLEASRTMVSSMEGHGIGPFQQAIITHASQWLINYTNNRYPAQPLPTAQEYEEARAAYDTAKADVLFTMLNGNSPNPDRWNHSQYLERIKDCDRENGKELKAFEDAAHALHGMTTRLTTTALHNITMLLNKE